MRAVGPDITWRDALRWGRAQLGLAGIEGAGVEAEYLARPELGAQPVALLYPERRPAPSEWCRYVRAVRRRAAREPLAYIRGETEFYSLGLQVGPEVLIPRPETETLVEVTVQLGGRMPAGPILELGTGSGAVAAALAVNLPGRGIVATDISRPALRVACANVRRHDLTGQVQLLRGDLFAPVADRRFAAVVSNPPYVRSGDLHLLPPEIRFWEPVGALDGGEDGLDFLRRIVREAPRHLRRGGFLILETGAGQAGRVRDLCRTAIGDDVRIEYDLAGNERLVVSRYAG